MSAAGHSVKTQPDTVVCVQPSAPSTAETNDALDEEWARMRPLDGGSVMSKLTAPSRPAVPPSVPPVLALGPPSPRPV